MKVAFVHDWLVTYRGGEKVLEALLELYPEAPIYTLFYDAKKMPETIKQHPVKFPKLLNKFRKFRKLFLPVYPMIIESMPLEKYDLIISTSSCVAKGAIGGPEAKHICYIHSPMRYIWDQRDHYLKSFRRVPLLSPIINFISCQLRLWDTTSSHRVDQFVANSSFVRQRVKKYYGRSSAVIPPPVEVESFQHDDYSNQSEPFFLAAGALVSYKRFDLAIKACKLANVKLVIAGSGPQEKELRQLAGDHVEFMISPSKTRWAQLMNQAEALLFPGIEDFGITAIEAIASGTPLIAYHGGGALDFVVPQKTGTFFHKLTPESLAEKIKSFRKSDYSGAEMKVFSQKFNRENFLNQFQAHIKKMMESASAT